MIAISKFLIPNYILSKWTVSISSMSITKNGNSLIAIKQLLVGLTLTTDLWGQPKNSSSSNGISNSNLCLLFSATPSIVLTKFANLLFSFIFWALSLSSYSSSSMSLSFFLADLISISSAATPASLKNYTSTTFLDPIIVGVFRWKWIMTINSSSAQG